MTVQFGYDKKQVLQGLRYHFLNRREIKILLILVNVFAIVSAGLFWFKLLQPIAFLIFSLLWFILMLIIWRILPASIYRRSATFKDKFIMHLDSDQVVLETERGNQAWPWTRFSSFIESPYFFHLYFNPRTFFLLPKESFGNITDLQEIRNLLREKIEKAQ